MTSTIVGTFPIIIDIIINTSITIGEARRHLSRTVKGAFMAAGGETRIGRGKMRAVTGQIRPCPIIIDFIINNNFNNNRNLSDYDEERCGP